MAVDYLKMPSGKTHDLITLVLAPPAGAIGYLLTGDIASAAAVLGGFIFGGIMFGPDLDTVSRQYSRWSVFKFIWMPYRRFFRHRSRFSHGLIFGSLIRVIYFLGVLTLLALLTILAWQAITGEIVAGSADLASAWRAIGSLIRSGLGDYFLLSVFAGLWLGAASHTFTDMAGSYVKTGRITKFL